MAISPIHCWALLMPDCTRFQALKIRLTSSIHIRPMAWVTLSQPNSIRWKPSSSGSAMPFLMAISFSANHSVCQVLSSPALTLIHTSRMPFLRSSQMPSSVFMPFWKTSFSDSQRMRAASWMSPAAKASPMPLKDSRATSRSQANSSPSQASALPPTPEA